MPEPSRYAVSWSQIAQEDLEQIIDYVERDSLQNARRLWDRLRKAADTLAHFPLRARLVPELKTIGLDIYRELIVDPYRILFRIRGVHIFVLGVFDGRRDLEEVLFERLFRL